MIYIDDTVTIHMLSDIMDEQEQLWERGEHSSLLVSGEGVLEQFHNAEKYPVQVFYLSSERTSNGVVMNTVNYIWFDDMGVAL